MLIHILPPLMCIYSQNAIDTGMLFHSKDNVCLFYCRFASLKYNWRTMHSYGRHKAKMNESLFHISQVFFR